MPLLKALLPLVGLQTPQATLLSQWAIVLPKSLVEKQIRFFKFWFNHQLQDGLHYQNELFRCVQTVDAPERFRLYRLGSQLAQQGADVLVTHRQERYSLWVSLRSQPKALKSLQSTLPLRPLASSDLRSNLPKYRDGFSCRNNGGINRRDPEPQLTHSKRKVIGR